MKRNHTLLTLLLFIGYLSSFSQSTATKNVSTFEIEAPQLGGIKKIWIYLPSSYSTDTISFPVLYLQDAQNLFDIETSFAGEWRVDETLDSLNLNLIVVGIAHGNEKRIDELTPFSHPEYGGGNADSYLNFIIETLQPAINEKFRTSTKASETFIGGSSLGGLFSFYAALKHPEIFSKALVLSPSFWFSPEIFDFAEKVNFDQLNSSQIFFISGEKESEMVPLMIKMHDLLLKKGLAQGNLSVNSIPEGEHNEILWARNFPEAAQWLIRN